MIDNKVVGDRLFDMMPKQAVTIKYPSGVSYDPVTNRDETVYTTVNLYAYVGTWDAKLVNSPTGTNRLGPESKRVIVRDVDIDMDCIVEIGGVEYRIVTIEAKAGFVILGVTPK